MGTYAIGCLDAITQSAGVIEVARKTQQETIEIRRTLHKIPELSWKEEKTIQAIKDFILGAKESASLPFSLMEMRGGLVVDVTVDSNSPRLLFRADCDALPIEEETGLSFKSMHPGVMHACGHDGHSAMLLSAFLAIVNGEIIPSQNLRFVWQRAEEVSQPMSGGSSLVDEGVCEGVSEVYGLHLSSYHKSGVFLSRKGDMLANSSQVHIEVSSSGGHVMNPHIGSNAIDILTDLQVEMRGFASRYFNPSEMFALVPSVMHAGIQSNIRPSSGKLIFAFRNFLSDHDFDRFIQALKQRVNTIVTGYKGASLKNFMGIRGYPKLVCDEQAYLKSEQILSSVGFETQYSGIGFAGEDFAYYLRERPGAFWMLGADKGHSPDHHTPQFDIDEGALWQGVAFWLLLATHGQQKT